MAPRSNIKQCLRLLASRLEASSQTVNLTLTMDELVWCGNVLYGMVWYGMVWYGMVWYGMVWYGMVW